MDTVRTTSTLIRTNSKSSYTGYYTRTSSASQASCIAYTARFSSASRVSTALVVDRFPKAVGAQYPNGALHSASKSEFRLHTRLRTGTQTERGNEELCGF